MYDVLHEVARTSRNTVFFVIVGKHDYELRIRFLVLQFGNKRRSMPEVDIIHADIFVSFKLKTRQQLKLLAVS